LEGAAALYLQFVNDSILPAELTALLEGAAALYPYSAHVRVHLS
jgi:hypothetical protein